MALTHFQLFSVPVTDQEAAKAFYVDKLGFEVVRDNPMGPEQRWVEVALPGAETSMTLTTWFDTMPPGSLKGVVIETDDLDADVAALAARGVDMPGGVQDAPWGRFVTIDDPDGNGIVIQATAPGA